MLLPPGVDLVVLNNAPLELAGRIALHGKILFEYSFITAIEMCIDVAQHICAAQGWGLGDLEDFDSFVEQVTAFLATLQTGLT